MNRFKQILALATLATAAAAAGAADNMPGMDMSQGMKMPAPATEASATALTRGIVKKINTDEGKLTIQHEAIDNLGMPGMTMVFRAADRKLLQSAQIGQAIAFRAERVNGAIVVTRLQAQ